MEEFSIQKYAYETIPRMPITEQPTSIFYPLQYTPNISEYEEIKNVSNKSKVNITNKITNKRFQALSLSHFNAFLSFLCVRYMCFIRQLAHSRNFQYLLCIWIQCIHRNGRHSSFNCLFAIRFTCDYKLSIQTKFEQACVKSQTHCHRPQQYVAVFHRLILCKTTV